MSDGMLTAEQVRDAWCANLKRDCLYDPPTPDWQAIADELNEAMGAGESRWFELFGTPERAARTFDDFCASCDKGECNDCPLDILTDFCIGYDALLEWLRGDAE